MRNKFKIGDRVKLSPLGEPTILQGLVGIVVEDKRIAKGYSRLFNYEIEFTLTSKYQVAQILDKGFDVQNKKVYYVFAEYELDKYIQKGAQLKFKFMETE